MCRNCWNQTSCDVTSSHSWKVFAILLKCFVRFYDFQPKDMSGDLIFVKGNIWDLTSEEFFYYVFLHLWHHTRTVSLSTPVIFKEILKSLKRDISLAEHAIVVVSSLFCLSFWALSYKIDMSDTWTNPLISIWPIIDIHLPLIVLQHCW